MSTVKAETDRKVSSELLEEVGMSKVIEEMALAEVRELRSKTYDMEEEVAALRKQLAERDSELKALESRNAQLHDQVEYQAHEIEDLRRQLEVALLPTS